MKKENIYVTEEARLNLAYKIAAESIVLLKNENNILPLNKQTIAMLGQAIYKPNLGGMGSGMSFMNKEVPSISEACRKVGIIQESHLEAFYTKHFENEKQYDMFAELQDLLDSGVDLVASGAVYEIFGKYNPQPEEIVLPQDLVEEAAKETDTALLMLGRITGGEECDRYVENDYYLLDSEIELVNQACKVFSKVILIVNTNGLTDLKWIDKYPEIQAVLFIGAGGEQGPRALADVLGGTVVPSGKLAFTIANSYEDYSTAKDFSFNKKNPETILEYKDYNLDAERNGSIGFVKSPVTVYKENIYMGYRYFDSFGISVQYPFGFGKSYAEFEIQNVSASLCKDKELALIVTASINNISNIYNGKEIVQFYVSAPQGKLEQPYQTYKGCVKTGEIKPGSSEQITMNMPICELTSYDEEKAAWILEAGDYYVRIGNSSRNTHIAACIRIEEMVIVEKVSNCISMNPDNEGKINLLSAKTTSHISYSEESLEKQKALTFVIMKEDFVAGKSDYAIDKEEVAISEIVKKLTDKELIALSVGYATGLPFGALGGNGPCTVQDEQGKDVTENTHPTGSMGYVSPAIPKYHIPSTSYKDGPASVGKIAWPTAMTMACCFNDDLFYAFGSACAKESEEQQVDSWLAPALNLHRNPIGGRNFEYFSEDPYLTGACGINICKGAAETTNVTCCPKHFAINEQETYRRGSSRNQYDAVDSIITERAARELYLKPFEMVVKNAPVRTMMTAFNKINGTFAGGSYDLCTQILRKEWNYQGVVVTDWGDMDIVVDGADAVAAGNDVVMPGGPPVIDQIQKGYEEGRVTREQLEEAVSHLLIFVMHSVSYKAYCSEVGIPYKA